MATQHRFIALDFETADSGRDSACALGIVLVENQTVVRRARLLIRPPRKTFAFTKIHGITWHDVKDQPTFPVVWNSISDAFREVDFIAAHNARFDRGVLHECCRAADLTPPHLPFLCTVNLARAAWEMKAATLPDVCAHLSIALDHHDALSDAEACASIVLEALRQGVVIDPMLEVVDFQAARIDDEALDPDDDSEKALVARLDHLADLRFELGDLDSIKAEAIDRILSPQLRAEVQAIEDALATESEELQRRIQEVETQVKEAALRRGASIKGHALQAVWAKGRVTWDSKALDQYSKTNPEVLPFRKQGEPTVTIRSTR